MRYRALVTPLYEGRRQEVKASWEYTDAASVMQAGRFLRLRYPYPKYIVGEPMEDPRVTKGNPGCVPPDIILSLQKELKDEKEACSNYHEIAGKLYHAKEDKAADKISRIADDECGHYAILSSLLEELVPCEPTMITSSLDLGRSDVAYYRITDPGKTIFHEGDLVSTEALYEENARVIKLGETPAIGKRKGGESDVRMRYQ